MVGVVMVDGGYPWDYIVVSFAAQRRERTARWSAITQIYEGTNQIQRMVMARQLLK
jgi:alkylation response protein AidB-like acyl-CoA dehydrogenase